MSDEQENHQLVVAKPYVFCPWCGSRLVEVKLGNRWRRRCAACNFVNYANPVPAAGAIVETDGKVLLVKRKYPPYVGDWNLPAGFMEEDETPETCCRRELREETGLDVEIDRLFSVLTGDDDPRTRAVLIVYLARVMDGQLRAGDDASEAAFFPLDQIPSNIAFRSHRKVLDDFRRYKETGAFPSPLR